MGLISKNMETMTQVKTQSVTKLKLAVATLAAVLAGNAALATLPGTSRQSIPVPAVISCNSTATGITVQRELKNSCNASTNQGIRYVCTSPNVYKKFWQTPCDGTPAPSAQSESFANVSCANTTDGIIITENYDSGCSGIKDYQYSCASDNAHMILRMNDCTTAGFFCSDSDKGLNPVQKGQTVMFNALTRRYTGSVYDSCVDSDTVSEGFCSGGAVASQPLDCPAGYSCSAGKCAITDPALVACIDHDGADSHQSSFAEVINLSSGAIVSKPTDTCMDNNTVQEAVCSGDVASFVSTRCLDTERCDAGKCSLLPTGKLDVFTTNFSGVSYVATAVGADTDNSEVDGFNILMAAHNESIKIKRMVVKIEAGLGDPVLRDYQAINLYNYNGSSLLASVEPTMLDIPGVGPTPVADFSGLNYIVAVPTSSATTTARFTIKYKFNSVMRGVESGSSPRLVFGGNNNSLDAVLIEAEGVSSGNNLANDDINNAGSFLGNEYNSPVLYQSVPVTNIIALPTTVLSNGSENQLYGFSVAANSRGPVSIKQLKFRIDMIDRGATADSLAAYNFRLRRNGDDITNSVDFNVINPSTGLVESIGTSLSSRHLNAGSGQMLYVVWKNRQEEVVPAAVLQNYSLLATLSGFNTDSDNDFVRTQLLSDNVELSQEDGLEPRYLDQWSGYSKDDVCLRGRGATNQPYVVGLQSINGFSSGLAPNISAAGLIWSDQSAAGHSAVTSTCDHLNSSGDWFNSVGVNYSMGAQALVR